MTWLISYEGSNCKDESCLIVGRSYNDNDNNLSMEIIHTLYGQEADIIAEIIKNGNVNNKGNFVRCLI